MSDSDDGTNKKKLKSTVKNDSHNSIGKYCFYMHAHINMFHSIIFSFADGKLDGGIPYPMYPRFPPQPWYYETSLPLLYPGSTRSRRGRGGRGRGRGNWKDENRAINPIPSQMFYDNKQYYKYFANLTGQDYGLFEEDFERPRPYSRFKFFQHF